MHQLTKRLLALAAPLLLTGCLWGPGKFTSDLTVRKDGSFVLDYKGEIVLAIPSDQQKPEPWDDSMAICHTNGESELATAVIQSPSGKSTIVDSSGEEATDTRPCTAAEISKLKAQHDREATQKAAEDRKKDEDMAKLFGLPGMDDESNRAFAAKLSKYAGWRSVTYRGNGVFDVDYHLEGRATQDFIFPAIPDDNFIVPFVALRRRTDGSVLVTAPALTGGTGALPAGAAQAAGAESGGPPPSRAQGRFTIHTDGEVLTNNSEDGPSADPLGRQVHWDVNPSSTKLPEALIRLQ
jgi:hypothetical protein